MSIKRIISGIVSFPLAAGGFYLLVIQAKGNGLDLNQDRWSINFIPGEYILLMLLMIPMTIGIFLGVYAITGKGPNTK